MVRFFHDTTKPNTGVETPLEPGSYLAPGEHLKNIIDGKDSSVNALSIVRQYRLQLWITVKDVIKGATQFLSFTSMKVMVN